MYHVQCRTAKKKKESSVRDKELLLLQFYKFPYVPLANYSIRLFLFLFHLGQEAGKPYLCLLNFKDLPIAFETFTGEIVRLTVNIYTR